MRLFLLQLLLLHVLAPRGLPTVDEDWSDIIASPSLSVAAAATAAAAAASMFLPRLQQRVAASSTPPIVPRIPRYLSSGSVSRPSSLSQKGGKRAASPIGEESDSGSDAESPVMGVHGDVFDMRT